LYVSFEVCAQKKMRVKLYTASSIVIAGGRFGTDMHIPIPAFAAHHPDFVAGRGQLVSANHLQRNLRLEHLR